MATLFVLQSNRPPVNPPQVSSINRVLRNIASVKEQTLSSSHSSGSGSMANSVHHQMNAALQSSAANHLSAAIQHSVGSGLNSNNAMAANVYDHFRMLNNQNWPRSSPSAAWYSLSNLSATMSGMQHAHEQSTGGQHASGSNQLTNGAADTTSPLHSALHQHSNSVHQPSQAAILDAHQEGKQHLSQLNGLHPNQHSLHQGQSNGNLSNQPANSSQQLAQQFYGQQQLLLNHMTGSMFSSANSTGDQSSSGAPTPVHLTATTPTQPNSHQCATPATTITDKLNDDDSCSALLSDDCDGVNSTSELEVALETRMQLKKKIHRNRTSYSQTQREMLEKGKQQAVGLEKRTRSLAP